MAEVATLVVSPLLELFFERMASGEFLNLFRRRKLSDGLLKKLKTSFLTLDAVLQEAEELDDVKPAVKVWLDEVKGAVYDAEDVLDEISTEALLSEWGAKCRTTADKVQNFISAFGNPFVKEIEHKIEEILQSLETLINQGNAIGLREGLEGRRLARQASTCLVDESSIFGRDEDKEAVINMVLSDDAHDTVMGVIAIVGMGGIGKTTLAQCVYNDDRVKQYFDFCAWVCVSEQFDLFMITKIILERLTSTGCNTKDLDLLQCTLKEKLMGKRFLFVLDDIWNKNYADWENLSKPFTSGVLGSKVIITARDSGVASAMRASSTYSLKNLSVEDSWSLFAEHAFRDNDPKLYPQLEQLGRQILKKCDGLPLAIKTIGALLGSELDIDRWNSVLKCELWDLPSDEIEVLPALRLSYKYLPPLQKRCFAYCSIFPKNYVFEKNQIILLWMAEGFLHQFKNKTMEEVGTDCFDALVSRSFFLKSSDNNLHFVMHDLMNDLAASVAGEFTFRLEGDYSPKHVNKVRYLSYVMEEFDGLKKFEFLYEAYKLRTFLPLNTAGRATFYLTKKIPHQLLWMLKCLRVVSLANYVNMIELPDSISKLKHLRYLNFSFTNIKRLPDSICWLCNLQTLNLSYCGDLAALPKETQKLINLRHLDIIRTGIREMPVQLGALKYLQTLTEFIIGNGSGSCIGELGKLTNLKGSIRIVGLQNVVSASDSLSASIIDKKYLYELELVWNVEINTSEHHRTILDTLQPHRNLRRLAIYGYSGKSFSNWVGHPLFSDLTSINLEDCKHCRSLPPLGQLPSLQKLSISKFDEVVTVGQEFRGSISSPVTPFRVLKVLRFEKMAKWEQWFFNEAENGVGVFPKLTELYIGSCPKLIRGLPVHLPSLTKFVVDQCPLLVASPSGAPTIGKLKELSNANTQDSKGEELGIQELDAVKCLPKDGIPFTLQILCMSNCEKLVSLLEGMKGFHNCLQVLEISDCSSFISLPTGSLSSTLKTLRLIRCTKLESLPEGMIDSNSCLQELQISECSSLVSLPKGGLPTSLKYLNIDECVKLELATHLVYPSLTTLFLNNCDSLKCLPLELFPKLYQIRISHCSNLESLALPEDYEPELVTLSLLITYCPKLVCFPKEGLRAPNLTFLAVVKCRSLSSLPNKMHVFLPSLEKLTVSDCPKVESFPEGGLPSNLKSICLDYKLAASLGQQNLPFLRHLEISGRSQDVESFPETQLLPAGLTSLEMVEFPNLKLLDKKWLQNLRSLKSLDIWSCPNLRDIPKQGLPESLSTIRIHECPLLEKHLQRKGKGWRKSAHVEQIWIDGKLIE